jgi:RNA polymerase sigma-70 factor, ECF subfamily
MRATLPQPSAGFTDAELVLQAARDPAQGFAAIMRQNNRRLYCIARSILKDNAEAEDALQESYLRAFRNLDNFRADASLSTWLARIVINEALGRLRQQRRMLDAHKDDEVTRARGQTEPISPEVAAAQKELKGLLERAIDGLPTRFRVALVACAIEQMSIEEAALSLGVPPSTVKTRLFRAKRLLRVSLGSTFASVLEGIFPFAGVRCDRIAATVLQRLGLPVAPEVSRSLN